jgi:hypothetical protein
MPDILSLTTNLFNNELNQVKKGKMDIINRFRGLFIFYSVWHLPYKKRVVGYPELSGLQPPLKI